MNDGPVQRLIKNWPWAETMVAVTLFLAVAYIVVPFALSYAGRALPSDTVMDHSRNLLTVMFVSGVLQVIGERATWKKEAAEFKAARAEGMQP